MSIKRTQLAAAILALCCLFLDWSADSEAGVLTIRIPCRVGAEATAALPGMEVKLGKVRAVPVRTNWPAYTASKWGRPGTVCATAVNAIHILIDVEGGRGRIVSVVPTVTVAPAAPPGAFFAIDAPAGTGLFGGCAPLTGSRVFRTEDALVIESDLPSDPYTWALDFENRPGGRVIAWTKDGPKTVARVVRPVRGVGRFGGGEFQTVGRIRASHSGVIDVSVSPRGKVGGFQIMPLTHAATSKEMAGAWTATQWMIVAPLPGAPPLEGTPPLFEGTLLPGSQLGDSLGSVWSTYGRKPLVLARIDGAPWQLMPEVTGKADAGLKTLTHIRIYLPFF
ncbi:MAG: hypothetical protein LBR38_06990 [Synergistaceae bacterium]|jgi:hypothetical protein|nr:hypothetical protein [Synergistaceae bacterium]